ncbi:MAG: peptidase domain-containing ABC transporter [Saprospiraceae bacterium]
MLKKFPHHRQPHSRDCGATCLGMIAEYYGKFYRIEYLRKLTRQTQQGATLLGISDAAEHIGMHTVGAKLTYHRLIDDIPLPGIAHWKETHFVVVVDANQKEVVVADPDMDGVATISKSDFLKGWTGNPDDGGQEGIILLMEPTAAFYTTPEQQPEKRDNSFIWKKILEQKALLTFLVIGILFSVLLAVTFPFILQTVVDESIYREDIQLLNMILIAWIALFISQVGLEFVRRFILFHIGTKVNIELITEFMMKVLTLPIRFFLNRLSEDVLQTLYDNPRVQRFFTQDALSLLYAALLLSLFSLVLVVFSVPVFLVFLGASLLQALFIHIFLKKRKALNYYRYELSANHFSKLNDLIRGIKDIKLNNAERTQRWIWEQSEAKLYQIGKKYALSNELSLQVPFYLGELRNIFIIYLSARAVMDGDMSVGVLMAIIFIVLQLDKPLKQVIEFFLGLQETRLSLERMDEIRNFGLGENEYTMDVLPESGLLEGENVSFRYDDRQPYWVIKDLDFKIVPGKTTAIVGPSGSGKTTLLHLLLNFYKPEEGSVKIGDIKLSEIRPDVWLEKCGVVQQDGHLLHDTVARNIALGDDIIDNKRLMEAARIANILPFLERMPKGFGTVVGEGGVGLSKGQRQGILIARAVYRKPDYLLLDEATNDLDEANERIVLQRIQKAFSGKTIIIAASRPNLPMHIDRIIPLAVPSSKKDKPNELASSWGGNRRKGLEGQFGEILIQN